MRLSVAVLLALLCCRPSRADEGTSPYVLGAAAAAGFGSLLLLDQPVRTAAQNARNGSVGDAIGRDLGFVGSGLNQLGMGFGGTVVPAMFYLGGAATGSTRARRTGVQAIEAYFMADTITKGGKSVFGRALPGAGDSDDLHLISPGGSFPSSHAAGAFSVATVIAGNYDSKWVKGLAYGTASAVAMQRIYVDGHWLSDVAVGSALGYFVGRFVAGSDGLDGVNRRLYFGGNSITLTQKF